VNPQLKADAREPGDVPLPDRSRSPRRWRRLLVACGLATVGCLLPASSASARTPVAPERLHAWAVPLPRPLTVTRAFDPPATPYGPGHRGVDLEAVAGTTVRAPGEGVVHFAGPVAGRPLVSVEVDGLRFTYEPVRPLVRTGEAVRTGSVLGVLLPGHAGCGTCLHWGVRQGATYLDPLRPLRRSVRLLPLGPAPPTGPGSPRPVPGPKAGVVVLLARRRARLRLVA
jgi:murein DD-endopeptidase MepM/ murein hydrolase activator NlpD